MSLLQRSIPSLVTLAFLAACGAENPTMDSATTAGTPTLVTVTEYSAMRPQQPTASPQSASTSLTLQDREALFNGTRQMALEELKAQLGLQWSAWNVLAAPPLILGHMQLLKDSARGETLAQVEAQLGPASQPAWAQHALQQVSRQMWGQHGKTFHMSFLQGSDHHRSASSNGNVFPVPFWQGNEIGFASYAAHSDPAFLQGLATMGSNIQLGDFYSSNTIQLIVLDSVQSTASWPATVIEQGSFERPDGERSSINVTRLTAGVTRHTGLSYQSNAIRQNGRTLIVITPNSGSLAEFVNTRLDTALQETVAAMIPAGDLPGAGVMPQGELVLPVGEISFEPAIWSYFFRRNITLPYSETDANLRGLDLGGAYLQVRSPNATLKFHGLGYQLRTGIASAYTYSSLNQHGPNAGVIIGPGFGEVTPPPCYDPASEPTLRSFVIAVVDDFHTVLSLAAVRALPGDALLACIAPAGP